MILGKELALQGERDEHKDAGLQRKWSMTALQRVECLIAQRRFNEAYDTASTVIVVTGCLEGVARNDNIPADDTFRIFFDNPKPRCQLYAHSRRWVSLGRVVEDVHLGRNEFTFFFIYLVLVGMSGP